MGGKKRENNGKMSRNIVDGGQIDAFTRKPLKHGIESADRPETSER